MDPRQAFANCHELCRLAVTWWADTVRPTQPFSIRLRSKIFLCSALVILVLAVVSTLSLAAVGRVVSTNREITTRAIPALTLTVSAREALAPLRRLEARAVLLGDQRFTLEWTRLAAKNAKDLDSLAVYAASDREARYLVEASAAFEQYERIVAEELALVRRGGRERALRLSETTARARAEQVEEALDGFMGATNARVVAAQAGAARLEIRTWTTVVIGLAGGVGLALLAAALLARRMTRSLDVLASATAEVAAGAFRDPIAVESRDEIAALARSFNAMASRLRQIDETKQEFFATVTHELRSPLTSIRGAVDLLHSRAPGALTEKQERLTDIIGLSCERLLRLANQIIELSRLRAGVQLDRKPLDLAQLAAGVVEELHPQAEDAGVILERECRGVDFAYPGDEQRLHQLLINLGANAIRFTPRGGRVAVRVIDAGPEFELQVEDTGIGIPDDALPSIFEPYRQAHQDRGGTGLGLAIVRGVATAHGGRVTAESREAKGSRFTVLLPRS
jgi:signal transduction histidine kinase